MKSIITGAVLGLVSLGVAAPASALDMWTLSFEATVEAVERETGLFAYEEDETYLPSQGVEAGSRVRLTLHYDADGPPTSESATYGAHRPFTYGFIEVGGFVLEITAPGYQYLTLGGNADTEYRYINWYLSEGTRSVSGSFRAMDTDFLEDYYLPVRMDETVAHTLSGQLFISDGDERYRAVFGDMVASFDEGALTPPEPAAVGAPAPLPAPALLLGAGLAGLAGFARLKRA